MDIHTDAATNVADAPQQPASAGVYIAPASLRAVLDLYEQGQMLAAHELSLTLGPIQTWRGPAARMLAGRLAHNLGSPRLGSMLHRLAYRETPADPDVIYYYARYVCERHGPLRGWEFFSTQRDLPDAPAAVRADWFSLGAAIMAGFRDFDEAERFVDLAESTCPNRSWIKVERSYVLERQDRYADALAVAREALQLHPWYRPAVHAVARLLQLTGQEQDALDLLIEAGTLTTCASIAMQLAALQTELGLHAGARASLDRVVELSPLMDKYTRKYLAAKRSDAAYYCGDIPETIRLGRESDNDFHKKVADKLEAAPADAKRVLLSVPFVRQHQSTCAPATLSAISRFWSMPADHLEVAEKICYDGTPAHSEREWALQNGYITREFTVTWPVAVALIDRGIPFTLTTVEPTSAHLQACIGYDSLRGTLLIRDPFMPIFGEFVAEPFFENYQSSGPRGMVMVPTDRAALLEGIDLPDAEVYDLYHQVNKSLSVHARAAADEPLRQMVERFPEHRLTINAQRALASYDGNPAAQVEAVDRLLKLFPEDQGLTLSKVSGLRLLARRDERVALLREAGQRKGADPVFWSMLAQELRDDAREHPEAIKLLRKVLRRSPGDAGSYYILAGLLWDDLRWEESLQLHRFATTLDDKNPAFARSWFIACRHFNRTGEAVDLLRRRYDRLGRKSSLPASTLAWAYEELDKTSEALALLDDALQQRPDDGDLLLQAVNYHGRHGRFDLADGFLARAKDRCRPGAFLRASAELAQFRGDSAGALDLWRKLLDDEPLAMDAHRWVTRLLAEREGPEASRAHVEQACGRFPHSSPLHQLWIDHVRTEDPGLSESVIRKLIELQPTDAWAWRELVYALRRQQRLDEAMQAAETALRLDPTNPSSPFYVGMVHQSAGRMEEARANYRRAVELSVDADWAISELLGCCHTVEQQHEALAFVRAQLIRQTIFGDGLLAYRGVAADTLDAEELLGHLREAYDARPDLWHAWAAVAQQLSAMGRLDEAIELAEEATRRFPLLPRLYTDLASYYRLRADEVRGDGDAETAALRQALLLSPGWSFAVRLLSEVYDRSGRFEEARQALEQAATRSPLDPYNHGCLADVLWTLGRKEEAIARAKRAADLEPGYPWVWDALRRWTAEMGKPEEGLQIARDLTAKRAGEARSWLVLARMLQDEDQREERLAALDKAVELNPRSVDAHEQRARVLTEMERFDEAEAACRPAAFGDAPPVELRARAAWVSARRNNLPAAIEQMRAILAEAPNFYWGWGQLADWHRMSEQKQEWRDTLEQMAKFWPNEAGVHGRLGEARLANDDRAGAKVALRRAVSLAPDYAWALYELFDLCIQDNEVADAERILALLKAHNPGPHAAEREIEVAAKRGNLNRALELVAALAVTPMQSDLWPLKAAIDAIERAGWTRDLQRVLFAAAEKPEAHAYLGDFLVRRQARELGDPIGCRALVDRLRPFGEVGKEALCAWIFSLANYAANPPKDQWWSMPLWHPFPPYVRLLSRRFRRLIDQERGRFRTDDRLWGVAGFAYRTVRDYKTTIAWMADWRSRKEAEGWMLVNLAEANRALGRTAESHEISLAAIDRCTGQPRGIHLLWLSADAILSGDLATAESRISEGKSIVGGEDYESLATMLEATLKILQNPKDRRGVAALRRQIDAAIRRYPFFRKERDTIVTWHRLLKKIAAAGVDVGTRLWCLRRKWM